MTFAIHHHDALFFAPLHDQHDAAQCFADALDATLADSDDMAYILASLLPVEVDCEAVIAAAGLTFAELLQRRFAAGFIHASLFGADVLERFEALVEDRAAARMDR